jgi:transposase
VPSGQQSGQQVEVDEHEQLVERVAAVDVAKASGMVCVRVPNPAKAGKRITTVWQVSSMTNQILELAEQLAGQGIQRVVVESTSDSWRPFVYLLEARGWWCGWSTRVMSSICRVGPRPTSSMRCGWASSTSGAGCGPGSSRLPRSAGCGTTPGCALT